MIGLDNGRYMPMKILLIISFKLVNIYTLLPFSTLFKSMAINDNNFMDLMEKADVTDRSHMLANGVPLIACTID